MESLTLVWSGLVAATVVSSVATLPGFPPPRRAAFAREGAAEARRLGAVLALKDVSRACEAYETAARLELDDTWTWIQLSRLARQAGRFERAAKAAARAQEIASAAGIGWDRSVATSESAHVWRAQGNRAGTLWSSRLAGTETIEVSGSVSVAAGRHSLGPVVAGSGVGILVVRSLLSAALAAAVVLWFGRDVEHQRWLVELAAKAENAGQYLSVLQLRPAAPASAAAKQYRDSLAITDQVADSMRASAGAS